MPRSLQARLLTVLLGLLAVFGIFAVGGSLFTTGLYFEEVNQNLHRDLALNIVSMKSDVLTYPDGSPRAEGLQELFHWLMVVNPKLEVYLVDHQGRLLAYDAPDGAVVRERIDLEPLRAFLESPQTSIIGDDPRSADGQKPFSVAALPHGAKEPLGYLYIVLFGSEYDGASERLRASHILRLAFGAALGFALLAAVFGWFLFSRMTRPLRELAEKMRRSHAGPEEELPCAKNEVALLQCSFQDMTERIDRQMAELERVEGLRRELIANVSHDLRTPLATLQGYLETLALRGESLSEAEREEYLQSAIRQSERLGRLISELFELTKLENDDIELRREIFSLPELVSDNVQRFQILAEEKGVRLGVRVDAEAPFVSADIGLIERALENLLSNAVRFTDADGEVTVLLRQQGDEAIEVRVADTGVGIDEVELPHVFDRYYRGRYNKAAASSGAGLGLAITKRILDLHDAAVSVESTFGRGTTFSFSLPLSVQ